jgi:hypothetical protein
MNTICPYCSEPLHYSVIWVDTVVPCGHCGREFLLTNRPHDDIPKSSWSPVEFRRMLHHMARMVIMPFSFLAWLLMEDE